MTELTSRRDAHNDPDMMIGAVTAGRPLTAPAGSRPRRDVLPLLLGTLGCLLALGIWEAAARLALVPPTEVPPASHVLRVLAGLATDGPFWSALADTMLQWGSDLA